MPRQQSNPESALGIKAQGDTCSEREENRHGSGLGRESTSGFACSTPKGEEKKHKKTAT